MRVVLWNCKDGINKQSQVDYFNNFEADLAILPELKEKNIETLSPDSAIWVTNNHYNRYPKGLGVLSFNGFNLEEYPRDEEMEIFIPLKVFKEEFSMNLLAVWNFYWACKQGRFKDVRGDNCLEWSALRHYKPLFDDPIMVAGDWNFGPTLYPKEFDKLDGMLEKSGLKSLYHIFHKIPLLESNHMTFRAPTGHLHHLDHIFGSKYFYANMKKLSVGDLESAVLSDHAPIILDM